MKMLYPKVVVKAQSFKNVKKVVLPNQSMTLKQIIDKFVRKESLPVAHEGQYIDGYGDLEKMSKDDLVTQYENIARIKAYVDRSRKAIEDSQKPPAIPDPVQPPKPVEGEPSPGNPPKGA